MARARSTGVARASGSAAWAGSAEGRVVGTISATAIRAVGRRLTMGSREVGDRPAQRRTAWRDISSDVYRGSCAHVNANRHIGRLPIRRVCGVQWVGTRDLSAIVNSQGDPMLTMTENAVAVIRDITGQS